jgi:hypothetical protein
MGLGSYLSNSSLSIAFIEIVVVFTPNETLITLQ